MGLVEGASYHRSNHPEACQPCFWQGWHRSWSPYILNHLRGGDGNDERYRQTRYLRYSITDIVPFNANPREAFKDVRLTNWAKRAQLRFENADIREMRSNTLGEVVPFKNQLAGSRQLTNNPPPPSPTARRSRSNTRYGITSCPYYRPGITPSRCKGNP
ncbi:hypothetical protein NW752_004156 [Fusarium irregulare]|uniref:Uncharacterized protein n=1 Tax=Fusarium irregulare TaxID=2494466 RepID=A0A9W8U958_9HYPO|nr:hypothetical protein NW766_007054 [Fusarium irregulare]KAJ4021149.1 hypothetical protein NW752_004156 [Fusarium irregulare]